MTTSPPTPTAETQSEGDSVQTADPSHPFSPQIFKTARTENHKSSHQTFHQVPSLVLSRRR